MSNYKDHKKLQSSYENTKFMKNYKVSIKVQSLHKTTKIKIKLQGLKKTTKFEQFCKGQSFSFLWLRPSAEA